MVTITRERRRSHWGWGWEDKFPNSAGRKNLAQMLQGVLGFPALTDGAAVPEAAIELNVPRLPIPEPLAEICTQVPRARLTHTYGRAYRDVYRGFRGEFSSAPDIVAHPRDESDVGAILDWASAAHVAVVPYGGGTSVVGGLECAGEGFAGVLSLDMARLNRVLEVDLTSRAAKIQAGAKGPELEAQLAPHGVSLRHFPQSFEFSTLGGWIATRAGGHFATLYTHIDDLVESTRMLTPAGLLETRRLPGSGAGPSPDRLTLGSEGALGVITEAWVRLQTKPQWRASATVRFGDFERAVEATRHIAQAGLYPANCRLLDKREALLHQVVSDGSHVLVLGFESAHHPVQHQMELALGICVDSTGRCLEGATYTEAGAKAGSTNVSGRWREAFFDAPYLQNVMVSLGVIADTFETSCTWDRFPSFHAAIVTAVRSTMKRVCGHGGFLSCRFTHVYPDGPAPYYTFLAPGRPGGELEQWRAIKSAASDAIIENSGTITHHHSVGRMHEPWYRQQQPALFGKTLLASKGVLDPAGILNPGVLGLG